MVSSARARKTKIGDRLPGGRLPLPKLGRAWSCWSSLTLRVLALKNASNTSPTTGMAPSAVSSKHVRRHPRRDHARHAIVVQRHQDDPRLDQAGEEVAADREQTEQGVEPDA